MNEYIIHAIEDGLESSSVILNVPSKHQGRRTGFSFTDKYLNEFSGPIMAAQATVISRNPIARRVEVMDAEIGDIVVWVSTSGVSSRWKIVDDRLMKNPYLVPAVD